MKRLHKSEIPQPLLDACIEYYPCLFTQTECYVFLHTLLDELAFTQGYVRIRGQPHKEPRLTFMASMHPDIATYTYAGKCNTIHAMTPTLLKIKERIEQHLGRDIVFDSVLVNYYRNGDDYISWHSDDERDIDGSKIGSVSFGATRTFRLREKNDHRSKKDYDLSNGDLILMKGRCQELFQHTVPKRAHLESVRLNLTFRCLKNSFVLLSDNKQQQ